MYYLCNIYREPTCIYIYIYIYNIYIYIYKTYQFGIHVILTHFSRRDFSQALGSGEPALRCWGAAKAGEAPTDGVEYIEAKRGRSKPWNPWVSYGATLGPNSWMMLDGLEWKTLWK